jgi:hypothetical protein
MMRQELEVGDRGSQNEGINGFRAGSLPAAFTCCG